MEEACITKLRKVSWFSLAVTSVIVGSVAYFFSLRDSGMQADRVNSMIALMGTVIFSVAAPILIRILAYQKSVSDKLMTVSGFLLMKFICLGSVCLGLFFALFAYAVPIYRYHLYLAVLSAIYGYYSVLPFVDNIKKDLAGFGVKYEVE